MSADTANYYGIPPKVKRGDVIVLLMQAIRAVIRDLHAGKIPDFPKVSIHTTVRSIRRTPNFSLRRKSNGVLYTASSLETYLGYRDSEAVRVALNVLELIEQDKLLESKVTGQPIEAVKRIVREIKAAKPLKKDGLLLEAIQHLQHASAILTRLQGER